MTTTDQPTLADRVQAAADRLQHAALTATPGTWTAVPIVYREPPHVGMTVWEIHAQQGQCVPEDVVSHMTYDGGGITVAADATWITLAQPRTGELLANLLRELHSHPGLQAIPALGTLVDAINTIELPATPAGEQPCA